jgi:hypothetical protein
MPGYTFEEKLISCLEMHFCLLTILIICRILLTMSAPDPRPDIIEDTTSQSLTHRAPPTALEALRNYIREWSKQDRSLQQYNGGNN